MGIDTQQTVALGRQETDVHMGSPLALAASSGPSTNTRVYHFFDPQDELIETDFQLELARLPTREDKTGVFMYRDVETRYERRILFNSSEDGQSLDVWPESVCSMVSYTGAEYFRTGEHFRIEPIFEEDGSLYAMELFIGERKFATFVAHTSVTFFFPSEEAKELYIVPADF